MTTILNTKTTEVLNAPIAFDSKGNPIDLASFVTFSSTKESLVDLVTSIKEEIGSGAVAGIDASDSWLGKHLAGQKPYTHRLANIWQMERSRETDFVAKWHYRGIAAHRLSRFLNHEKAYYHAKKVVKLHDGQEVTILVKRQFLSLEGNPILYIQFAEDGDGPNQDVAFDNSIKEIEQGLTFQGQEYEYAFSSGSQMRSLKGVFVLKDYKLPESYLSLFDRSIEGIEDYLAFLTKLRGADCILEAMTYGAYSHEFSTGYKAFLKSEKLSDEDFEEIFSSCSKFMARVGTAGTASESLGSGWRVKHMGEARFVWTDKIEAMFRDHEVVDYQGVTHKLYTDSDVETIKLMWKEGKLDGQSIGRASTICAALNKIGIKTDIEEVAGKLLQIRWAGVKGTLLVLPDAVLDMCKDPSGNSIYTDFDMIIEHNSWKFTPTHWFTGAVGPELELVNISKKKFSNSLNYQYLMALDGDNNDPDMILRVLQGLVTKQMNGIKECMVDPSAAEIKFGMTGTSDSPLELIGIDEYEMTQRSKVTKALAKNPDVIYDKWFRKKVMDLFRKTEEQCKLGKIDVEGANRYIISDPIAMLRTDKIVINPVTGLEDIIIESFEEVGLRNLTDCYWAGKDQEAVLFRSPCIHPGEPQKVTLTNDVPEYVTTAFGLLPVREIYNSMKDIIIINGFSMILEAMGGADCDGDTVLCVTDKDIVNCKDNMRKPLLVSGDAGTRKVAISVQTIKENMVFSLKNNGIGLITNFATTWRDVQLHVVRTKSVTPKMKKELKKRIASAKENAELQMPWSVEDTSISAILKMDVNDWKSVYRACNSALRQLRILQEISINTAKSGVFVEFGSTDPAHNNYNHLSVQLRASWHKPNAKDYQKYDSGSFMAELNKYVVAEWKALEEWAMETSSTLLPGAKANYGTDYVEIFDTINELRAQYGTQVFDLGQLKLDKESFNERFEVITTDIHIKLTILAAKYGVDLVAVACYDASNKDSRSKKQADGTSFVWNCFFEEFLATLEFLNEEKITHRLHKVFLNDKFTYERFVVGGACNIVDNSVYLEGIEIGTSSLPEGEYGLTVISGTPYIKVARIRSTIEELTVSLSGIKFPIVGFLNNMDKVAGEGMLTRENVKQYITGPLNKNIIITKAVCFGSNPNPSVGCYVRGTASTLMLIGVIPMEDKVLANALNDKAFRVSLPEIKESDSRLTIEIDTILKDFL